MKVAVIVELDENGEAGGIVHFFCCPGCRSQSSYHHPGCVDEMWQPDTILEETVCETCGRSVFRNADL